MRQQQESTSLKENMHLKTKQAACWQMSFIVPFKDIRCDFKNNKVVTLSFLFALKPEGDG